MKIHVLVAIFFIVFFSCKQNPAKDNPDEIDMAKFADGLHHWELFTTDTSYPRYSIDNYVAIANNIVSYQNEDGGWPKNVDLLAKVDIDSLKSTFIGRACESTFDNDNTHPQIEFLAKMYLNTGNDIYMQSAEKGLHYILNTQNKSGGWRGWDVDAITYNDDVTTGILNLILDIKENKPFYNWINDSLKNKLLESFDKGLDVTLKCQIKVNGIKKGWCQQHDHNTLGPIKARSYELPSVASKETVQIVQMLMRIENPSKEIIEAIEAAVTWLQESGIENLRIEKIKIPRDTYPGQNLDIDRIAVIDSTAKTIWARFYEIEDNTPMFCTRAGQKVYSLAEVNPERRGGYGWYGYWPEELLDSIYPDWIKSRKIKSEEYH